MDKKQLKQTIAKTINDVAKDRQWTIRRGRYDIYAHNDICLSVLEIVEEVLSEYFEDDEFELLKPNNKQNSGTKTI